MALKVRRPERREIARSRDHRGSDFGVHYDAANNEWSHEAMMVVLLSDIRDELHTLNRLLGCRNFTAIPRTLRDIETNTRKRTYTKQVPK